MVEVGEGVVVAVVVDRVVESVDELVVGFTEVEPQLVQYLGHKDCAREGSLHSPSVVSNSLQSTPILS